MLSDRVTWSVSLLFGMLMGLLVVAALCLYAHAGERIGAALQRELHRRDYHAQEAPATLPTRLAAHVTAAARSARGRPYRCPHATPSKRTLPKAKEGYP